MIGRCVQHLVKSLKIPLSVGIKLPFANGLTGFERIDAESTIGVHSIGEIRENLSVVEL